MGDEAGSAAAKAAAEAKSTEPVALDNDYIGSAQGIENIDENDLMGTDDSKGGDNELSDEEKAALSKSEDDKKSAAEAEAKKTADEKAAADKKAADEKSAADAVAAKVIADKAAYDKLSDDEKKVADDKKAADKKAADEKAAAEKKAADDKAASDKNDKDQKPPKGMVKIEALHEAREVIKSLKNENAKLKVQQYESKAPEKQAEPLVSKKEIKEFEGFKPLTDEEFEEKYEDDSKAGMKYMLKVGKFHDFQRRLTEDKLVTQQQERELDNAATDLQKIYDTTEVLMDEVLPGIFDDKTVGEELTAFAEEVGFGEDLFYLTNPETRIILPGESKPLVLGEQAADILKVLVTARTQLSEAKTAAKAIDKDALKAEIEKELRVEIEKELLAKFKKSGDGTEYKSLDDIPTSENENQFKGKVLSESDFSKLSETQQDAYLAGA